ncbi:MAG: helix-turn-helix transcriptional regulator [Bacteroidota bacterium]
MKTSLSLEVRKQIGARFRKIRNDKHMSLRDVEYTSGMGYSWIAKFEKGQMNFEIDTLINILNALEIQPKDIFDFEIEFETD